MARLSIVVPVYNNRAQLRVAVTSLLDQRVPGLEIVVVDDGSTDESASTVAELPVRIVRQENQGHPAARNRGLAEATGEIVGFLDSDDLAAPEGLARLVARLEAEPAWEIVGGLPAGVVDDDGRVVRTFGPFDATRVPRWLHADLYRAGKFFPVNVWLYLFRRSVFERFGGFDTSIRYSDDADMILRALGRAPIPILDVPVVFRRVHTANLSLDRSDSGLQLKPECIAELKSIYLRHGVRPRAWNWKPFELGFDLPGADGAPGGNA